MRTQCEQGHLASPDALLTFLFSGHVAESFNFEETQNVRAHSRGHMCPVW